MKSSIAGLAISFAFLSLGCGEQVVIRNHWWCADKGELGAYCSPMFTDSEEVDLDKDSWDAYRFGQFCGPSEAFADMKTQLLKLCKASGKCTVEMKALIRSFERNIEKMQMEALFARKVLR